MNGRLTFSLGLLLIMAFSSTAMAQEQESMRPRLIVKVFGGEGFYLMSDMDDTYNAARLQWSSVGGNEIHGIDESLSDGPGRGPDFGISATVPVTNHLAAGIQMNKASDGFIISLLETRSAPLFGTFTGTFREGDIDAKAQAIEVVGVYYPKSMSTSANIFLQIGIGYGSLNMKSGNPINLKASDISPAASLNVGVESRLFWGIFNLEVNAGVRWLRFSGFDVPDKNLIPREDLNEFEQEIMDIFDKGVVDFSGSFLRVGLAIRLF